MDVVTIISVSTALIELYGATRGVVDDAEERAWFRQVRGDLQSLNQTLSDILEILNRLEVTLDDRFRRDAEADVMALADTWIDRAPEFLAAPTSERSVRWMDDMLTRIQLANRKMMTYGYAGAFSVFYGMRVESDVQHSLRLGSDARVRSFSRFRDYFAACTNIDVPGSINNVLPRVLGRIAPLESQYPAQNNTLTFFDPPRWWKEYRDATPIGGDDRIIGTKWREHFKKRMNGSLEQGFTGNLEYGDIYNDSSQSSYYNSRQEAFNDADSDFQRYLQTCNSAALSYKLHKKDQDTLQAASEACARFREVSAQLLEEART